MTLYLDSSAVVKRYVEEHGSSACGEAMLADGRWVTARHSLVEVGRTLRRQVQPSDAEYVLGEFAADWSAMYIAELDHATCALALEIADESGARTLDALHLAAMWRSGGDTCLLLTWDDRQARAARSVGLDVHPSSCT